MAGGCDGWCAKNPPISTAEMYDPATDTWTQLPDLPFPLSASQMAQVNGKPTLIGGTTQETPKGPVTQTNALVSYDYKTNQWIQDGSINLPRSSHIVIQIPKAFLPVCH